MKEGVVYEKDERYPKLLAQINDSPKQLYYKGEWDKTLFTRCLAVVGTRKMTAYGKQATIKLVYEAAASGITIVSGFMYGIDAEAHQAAVDAGGKTIAVMPCGIDLISPEYQANLYEQILERGGLIISEMEGTYSAAVWTFPRRNRIVAGISHATLVVEAGENSGSLITANLAKEYGRTVFAVPNPITSPGSFGTTKLLQQGAKVAGSAKDILQHYGLRQLNKNNAFKQQNAIATQHIEGEVEQKVVSYLQRGPMGQDELARALKALSSDIGAAVSLLELQGIVEEEDGNLYLVS